MIIMVIMIITILIIIIIMMIIIMPRKPKHSPRGRPKLRPCTATFAAPSGVR